MTRRAGGRRFEPFISIDLLKLPIIGPWLKRILGGFKPDESAGKPTGGKKQ